jgi:hypothetical protein
MVRIVAHQGAPGAAALIATGLFFVAIGVGFGAWWLWVHPLGRARRAGSIVLGSLAVASLVVATVLPALLGARPALGRPSTTARLVVLSPREGEVFRGGLAAIPVELRVEGGRIVPITSFHLVPNEGHVHLFLDGTLVSMTSGTRTQIVAPPGRHELRAEFVAIDHAPFDPRVIVTVTFSVRG